MTAYRVDASPSYTHSPLIPPINLPFTLYPYLSGVVSSDSISSRFLSKDWDVKPSVSHRSSRRSSDSRHQLVLPEPSILRLQRELQRCLVNRFVAGEIYAEFGPLNNAAWSVLNPADSDSPVHPRAPCSPGTPYSPCQFSRSGRYEGVAWEGESAVDAF